MESSGAASLSSKYSELVGRLGKGAIGDKEKGTDFQIRWRKRTFLLHPDLLPGVSDNYLGKEHRRVRISQLTQISSQSQRRWTNSQHIKQRSYGKER